MHLKKRDCWIFDLDGTLTCPVHDFAFMRSELGLQPDDDILLAIEQADPVLKCTMMARLDELERHYAALAKPSEGALALLNRLSELNCRLGILTRNSKELALLSLKAIGAEQFFHPNDILGRDEVQPKPSPEGINHLINQWDSVVSSGVMVGDFEFDMLSGRQAGVMTVHVDKRDRHWPDVTDLRFSTLADVVLALK